MQTILGAGGAIGHPLAKELKQIGQTVRLVGRNPKKVNPDDLCFPADLLEKAEVFKAVEGSTVCYLTVGLEYKTKTWQSMWPVVMKNVIEACSSHGSKLVFFDNIYGLDLNEVSHINEESKLNAPSQKGKVREQIDRMLLEAVEKGKVEALIARAPDFFGPIKDKSVLMSLIYDNLKKGKKPQWLCRSDVPHSSGYAPELAKGTAMLGNHAAAFNQIWNLPVDSHAPTANQWADLFCKSMKLDPKSVSNLPAWGIILLRLIVPVVGEMYEMRYQYDRAYHFDSSKFNKHFSYLPILNEEAVKETIRLLE